MNKPDSPGTAGHYAPWLADTHRRVRAGLARLHPWLAEFIIFGFKQGWACLFGGLMLGMLIVSKLIWQPHWPMARYDALLVAAFLVQAAMLALKLETWEEAKVIFLFHLVGTAMEVFKTAMGSWSYPEPSLIRIGDVPLFTGFMYACVGSYIARVIRIFDMRFVGYPPFWATILLAGAIYVNFFSHHYVWDARYVLFACTFLVFWRTRIYFTVDVTLLAAFLTSVVLRIAENIGTVTGTWLYPNQKGAGWRPVTLHKMGAWYLLLVISFVLVTLVHRPDRRDGPPNLS
jgi:uncharacterized membrane protein YoaT (DUF817 family)